LDDYTDRETILTILVTGDCEVTSLTASVASKSIEYFEEDEQSTIETPTFSALPLCQGTNIIETQTGLVEGGMSFDKDAGTITLTPGDVSLDQTNSVIFTASVEGTDLTTTVELNFVRLWTPPVVEEVKTVAKLVAIAAPL